MMTPHTVEQLLQVFRLFRANHAGGMPLHRSYQEAVRVVAENFSVTYQTIGDGCRRRLELNNINELYQMLAAWVRGDPKALVRQFKEHSNPVAHAEIDQFFTGTQPISQTKQKIPVRAPTTDEPETVSFRLHCRDARLLRALAELEGTSVGELTARMVSGVVRERMKAVARGLIEETGTQG